MKKSIFIIAAIVFGSISAKAQSYSKRETLVKMPKVEVINYFVDNELDHQMVYWAFQNAKYQHITDIGAISAHNQEQLDLLIYNLETALGVCGDAINWTSDNQEVATYDVSKLIYIRSHDGKYTYMVPSVAKKVLVSLKEFRFQ